MKGVRTGNCDMCSMEMVFPESAKRFILESKEKVRVELEPGQGKGQGPQQYNKQTRVNLLQRHLKSLHIHQRKASSPQY